MLFNLFAAHQTPRTIRDQVPVYLPSEFSDHCRVTSRPLSTDLTDPAPPSSAAPGDISKADPCRGLHEKLDSIQALLQKVNERLEKIEEDLQSE